MLRMIEAGKSNLDLMKAGFSPIGKDGLPINLHHLSGTEPGPIAEMMQSAHQFFSRQLHHLQYDRVLHSFRSDTSLERSFDQFRKRYWQRRAKELAP